MPTSRACSAALAAGLLLLAAAPASAAGGITAPGSGEVVRSERLVPLRAVVEGPDAAPSELSVQAPGAEAAEVVATSNDPDGGELAHDLDTACYTAACTPAPNGTWTLRLSGGAEDERQFVLRLPPAAPVDVAADPSEAGVRLRWAQGDEPDLRGYRIEDGAGKVVRARLGLDVCDPERVCQVEVPDDAGSWSVRAFRATCPDCKDLLLSPASAVVRGPGDAGPVQVDSVEPSPAAVPPQAAPPARRPDQRSAFLGAFGGSRPVAPPAPQPAQPALRLPPLATGSYAPELGYGERELVVREPRAPLAQARDAVGSAVGSGDRVRLLVLSALMVGGALWLRRWARRVISD